MPIVDIELVLDATAEAVPDRVSARDLADAVGRVFGSSAGHTWVRLRRLDSTAYAENAAEVQREELPVFVTVLHARPPAGEALAAEALALTAAIARCLARPADCVHVEYAPAGAGRQAFGGRLVE